MKIFSRVGDKFEMKAPIAFRALLKHKGYSSKAVKEIWKWYDFSERKGINF